MPQDSPGHQKLEIIYRSMKLPPPRLASEAVRRSGMDTGLERGRKLAPPYAGGSSQERSENVPVPPRGPSSRGRSTCTFLRPREEDSDEDDPLLYSSMDRFSWPGSTSEKFACVLPPGLLAGESADSCAEKPTTRCTGQHRPGCEQAPAATAAAAATNWLAVDGDSASTQEQPGGNLQSPLAFGSWSSASSALGRPRLWMTSPSVQTLGALFAAAALNSAIGRAPDTAARSAGWANSAI